MGAAQWIILTIVNTLRTQSILVDNANLNYGKFYTVGNPDNEIPAFEISGMKIPAHSSKAIASSGRQGSPTGTEGSIDLYLAGIKICTVYWDCPWSGQNSVEVQNNNAADYKCTRNWVNHGHGPIGDVKVEVSGKNQGLAIDINV